MTFCAEDMTPVAIDAELAAKLTANCGQVPLTDRDGKPIGYFLSSEEYAYIQQALYDQAIAEVGEEELSRAEAQTGGYTTSEVLRRLGLE